MSDKNKTDHVEPDLYDHLSDEELLKLIENEAHKDSAVLAKLIMIQRIRNSLARERTLQRVMTAASIFLSGVALIVGIGGYFALNQFEQQRAERTLTACVQSRQNSISSNQGLEEGVATLYFIEALSVDPVNEPETTAFINNKVDERVTDIRKNYQKVRICTPEGIDKYNRSHGELGLEDGPKVTPAERLVPVAVP